MPPNPLPPAPASPAVLFWQRDDVAPLVVEMRRLLQNWTTSASAEHRQELGQQVTLLGDRMEGMYRASPDRVPDPPVPGTHDEPTVSPRWSFLSASMGGDRTGVDSGVCSTDKAWNLWQHPLMTAVRYSALDAIGVLVDHGRLRPTSPLAPVDRPSGTDQALGLDRPPFRLLGDPLLREVAAVLGRRGLAGGLAILQRYETDPEALAQQAMHWVSGAARDRQHTVIGEAAPWFSPRCEARPPFLSPMDEVLTYEDDVAGPPVPQHLQGVDTPERLRAVLDALLQLAPWEAWQHQDGDEVLRPKSRLEWLEIVVNSGADWAFDTLFPTVVPDAKELDRWTGLANGPDAEFEHETVVKARHGLLQRLGNHLLRQGLADVPPSLSAGPAHRRRL